MLFRALSCALVGMAAVGVAKPNVVILFVDDWYVCYAPRRLLSRHAVCLPSLTHLLQGLGRPGAELPARERRSRRALYR